MIHIAKQDLGLKSQTPLRIKAWVNEVEGFYIDWRWELENIVQIGPMPNTKLKVWP